MTWIFKSNSTGNLLWSRNFGSGLGAESSNGIIPQNNGDFVVAGNISKTGGDVLTTFGYNDWWLIRLSTNIGYSEPINHLQDVIFYPNPTSGKISISLPTKNELFNVYVFNYQGTEIMTRTTIYGNQDKFELDFSLFSKGIYFIRIIHGNHHVFRKIVIN